MSIQVKELEKLLKDSAISNKEGFLELYQKFVNKTNERAEGLENHQTFHYDKLGEAKKIPELLKQTVLRNHTRFILPKFSIPVKNKKTFLDLVAEQLSLQKRYKTEIPFLLMNSFLLPSNLKLCNNHCKVLKILKNFSLAIP